MKTKEDQEEGRKKGESWRDMKGSNPDRYTQGLKVLTKAKNCCRTVY